MAKGFKNFLKSEAVRLKKVAEAISHIEKTDHCIIMADLQNLHSFIKFDSKQAINVYFSQISNHIDKTSAIEAADQILKSSRMFYSIEDILKHLKYKPVAKVDDVRAVKNIDDAMNFLNTYAVRGFRG